MVITLSNLFELFEKDFISDSLALTNTAKRISGNNDILINFNQNSHVAFTDGKFIYLPKNINSEIPAAQGLVAHESGHIGYGSYELSFINLVKVISKKYTLPESLVKKVINVVEDVRINAINNIKFPGFYRNLRDLTKKLLPELKFRMKKSGDILIYVNLYMEDYQDFQKKPKFRSKVMSQEDWKSISVAKTFLLKTLTPASSIITIDQLCKILKKYYRKKIVRNIPQQVYQPSSGRNEELIYDEDFGFDVVEIKKGVPSKESHELEPEYDIDSDFMEDPSYFDESEYQAHRSFSNVENDPLLNHYEDFSDKHEIMQETELNTTSEKLIEKIKDSNLSTEDIENLIEKIDLIKEEKNERVDSEINKTIESIDASLVNITDELKQKIAPEINGEEILDEINQNALDSFEELSSKILSNVDKDVDDFETQGYLEEFIKLVTDAHNAMEDRLFILEKGISFDKSAKGNRERQVKEVRIENETMNPINKSYNEIIGTYKNLIARIKFIFSEFKNQVDVDNFQKRGRLNSKFIKAVTSEYKYKKCFSRKITQKELKILLLVDISGSMKGIKLESAKIAMMMLCEALHEIAQLRIVLFTGDYDAINILLKDFKDKPDPRKFDKFGCHANVCSNLDGISIKHEANKLEKDVLIIVISDGQPAGSGNYGLYDAIKEIHDVKKKFKVFAFSIDANGDYLDKLYDRNWILTKSSDKTDLGDKLIKFCKLVVKEFFR